MKVVSLISRLVVGAVFIFSGFVKAIDPLGSTYKFIDYFDAFKLEFLSPVAFFLSISLSSAEMLIGFALFLCLRMRITSWGLIFFMSFFTILAFVIALTNPVTDCGCFGDAFIMTNWQTFWKNIILWIFVAIIFIYRKKYSVIYNLKTE